ncbi:hypothetical protein PQJ75_20895 [Rhodoplanes sp. TEM]|uniref:Uncharacterized protein n=1 Tax=Rhodoplanes tepidamans TaxID=200616 RepID=A0ABT5J7N2_RHOTP|nr:MULTISPECIES: hypothetical protein [Rhodoplanes]MDC7785523.1 hypothetical protein [Rhodoplanes tepidamans]MDC7986195.1 hypothetical protein [Rhodoplanes sp. TEM]MDQ0353307.1 hypothetical protein [Rhodoplanes tepidamans]
MITENFGIILALLLIVIPSIGAMAMGSMGSSGTSFRPALATGRDDSDEGEEMRGHPVRNVGRNPDRR